MWGVKGKKTDGKNQASGQTWRATAPFMLIYYPANSPKLLQQLDSNVLIHRLGNSLRTLILLCLTASFFLAMEQRKVCVCGNRSSRQPAFTAGLHKGNAKPVLIWLQCEDDTGKPALLWTICKYLDRSPIAMIILLYLGGGHVLLLFM